MAIPLKTTQEGRGRILQAAGGAHFWAPEKRDFKSSITRRGWFRTSSVAMTVNLKEDEITHGGKSLECNCTWNRLFFLNCRNLEIFSSNDDRDMLVQLCYSCVQKSPRCAWAEAEKGGFFINNLAINSLQNATLYTPKAEWKHFWHIYVLKKFITRLSCLVVDLGRS